jgi:hypothetical protein
MFSLLGHFKSTVGMHSTKSQIKIRRKYFESDSFRSLLVGLGGDCDGAGGERVLESAGEAGGEVATFAL